MSIANIVGRGYGSFGSIGRIVTAGYSQDTTVSISDADAVKIANFVWQKVLDNGLQAQQLMRLLASAAGGEASGLDKLNPVYRSLADDKNRITATTDKYGNRTSITLDLT